MNLGHFAKKFDERRYRVQKLVHETGLREQGRDLCDKADCVDDVVDSFLYQSGQRLSFFFGRTQGLILAFFVQCLRRRGRGNLQFLP